jgi:hypothetical protein
VGNVVVLSNKDLDDLTSYADGEARVRSRHNCTRAQLREAALNANVEQCPSCGWWAESHEMLPIDSDKPDDKCSNCRVSK